MINFYSQNICPKSYTTKSPSSNRIAFAGKIPNNATDLLERPTDVGFSKLLQRLSEIYRGTLGYKNLTKKLEAVLNSLDLDDQYRVLSMVKKANGEPLYTKKELESALSVMRIEEVPIKARDIFAVATSGLSKEDALYTIRRIMTKDDLEVVKLMTRANGIQAEGTNVSRLKYGYKFNANDIQDVRMFVMDSADKPETLKFIKEVLENDYKKNNYANLMAQVYFNREIRSDGEFLMRILRTFKTTEQRESFINGMKNLR